MFIFKSLSLSSVFDLTLLSTLFILWKYEKIKKENLKFIFLIIGALTSYVDMLTYPLLTLGYPIIFLLLLDKKTTYKEKILYIIEYSIFWIIGYVFMWAGKWLISSIILKKNMFIDAYNNILIRSGNQAYNTTLTIKDTILNNFKYYVNPITVLLTIDIILLNVFKLIKLTLKSNNGINDFINLKKIKEILPFILTSLMPLVWYIVIRNHSYVHCFFTFRILSIMFLSIFIIITELSEQS